MKDIITLIQLLIAIPLILLILVQSKGKGLSRTIGSSISFERRGLEKTFFRLTFILSGLFILTAIASLVI